MFKTIKFKNISYILKLNPKNWHSDQLIYAYWLQEKEVYQCTYNNIKKWDICIDIWANIWMYTKMPVTFQLKFVIFFIQYYDQYYQQILNQNGLI